MQAALTVEGKMSNFDVVYTSSYLKRDVDTQSDYSDYAFFYDTLVPPQYFGEYFTDNAGDLINPSQYIQGKDGYTKISHEARFSTDKEKRLRFVGGLFVQRQTHDIQQAYRIDNLNDNSDVTGWDDTFWLTKQWRVDRDSAAYGELTFDVTDRFSITGGLRKFRTENSLEGFFGFGINNPYGSGTGENSCFDTGQVFETAPCTNLERTVKQNDVTKRFNANWHVTDDAMIYVTWSEGFRPGGVNRRGTFPPYKPDFLTNYEIGWKTSFANDRFRFNGAVYRGDWDDFQFSFLGENGLTNITNAGQAKLQGIEVDVQWAAGDSFTLYGGLALQEATLAEDFCKSLDANGDPLNAADCVANEPQDFAPEGTRLPTTPRFKANLTGRLKIPVTGMDDSHFQASLVHNESSRSALLPFEGLALGDQDAYTIVDMSFGVEKGSWAAEVFIDNVFDDKARLYRYSECDVNICSNADAGGIVYSVGLRPRTVGFKFSQKF
jgi:outer membrane receptor protein involved in Fe transport